MLTGWCNHKSQILRRNTAKLAVTCVDQFDTCAENVDVMSGHQVMRHRSPSQVTRHPRPKSVHFATCRTWVSFPASQRLSMFSMQVYWCLWMFRRHIKLTYGKATQGHAS